MAKTPRGGSGAGQAWQPKLSAPQTAAPVAAAPQPTTADQIAELDKQLALEGTGGWDDDRGYFTGLRAQREQLIEQTAQDYVNDPARGGEGTVTIGGITRGAGQRIGGSVAPAITYDAEGAPIRTPPPTQAEQIRARPDLVQSAPVTQFARSTPDQKGSVTSIANQMANAKALRSGAADNG